MQKRKLGNTNIHLSSLGFGAAPIGDLFENLDERSCYDILENAFNSNFNLFDTSPFYGNGLSEHRTGNFLKTVDEESYFLSHSSLPISRDRNSFALPFVIASLAISMPSLSSLAFPVT